MSELDFNFKSRIIAGRGKIEKIPHYIDKTCKRVVILADRALKKNNSPLNLLELLEKKNIDCVIYSEISDKATSRDLDAIVKIMNNSYAEGLIAMGGIKTLNLARIAVSAIDSRIDPDDILDRTADFSPQGKMCYIEVPSSIRFPYMFSSFTVITDGRNRNVKMIDCKVNPSLIVKDPELFEFLPAKTRDSIYFDILFNAFEAMSFKKRSFYTDSLIEAAVEKLLFYKHDFSVDDLSDISSCADFVYSVNGPGTGFYITAAINAYSLVPKSFIAAVLLPHFLQHYLKTSPGMRDFIIKLMKRQNNSDEDYGAEPDDEDILMLIRKKIKTRNLPLRLSELGIKKDILSAVSNVSVENIMPGKSVPAFTSRDLAEIFSNAY